MSRSIKALGLGAFVTLSATIGAPMTLEFEGTKLAPYYDSVGVKTWCTGETEVGYKEKFTKSECDFLYSVRYGYYSMTTQTYYNDRARGLITPEMHAAFTDMSYNVGLGAVKNSSMVRLINEGKPYQACAAILLYKKAGGQDCSIRNSNCYGVWKRRLKMHTLCTGSLKDGNPNRA